MYFKFGMVVVVERIFDILEERNLEIWNLMVVEYGKVGFVRKCMIFFWKMLY